MSEVLRTAAGARAQLPEAKVWALEQPAAKEEDQVETLSVQKIRVGGRGMCGVPARTPWKAASLRVCAQVPVRRVARAWARSAHLALQLADHR